MFKLQIKQLDRFETVAKFTDFELASLAYDSLSIKTPKRLLNKSDEVIFELELNNHEER